MKRLFILVTIVALVVGLSLTGLAATKRKNPKDIVIGFAAPYATHPAWAGMKAGALQAGKDGGFKVLWQGPGDGDVPKTVETVETFIAQKVDGIVVMPLSPSAFTPVLEKAKKLGIPVTVYGTETEKPKDRLAWVGTDNLTVGRMQIDGLHKALGKDDMKVGVIMSNLDATNQLQEIEAFKTYLKQFKDAKIVDIRDDAGAADDAKTLDVASAMLKAHPEINVMICTEGAGAGTIGKVVDEMNLRGKVLVSGYDDQVRNIAALKAGSVYSLMVQNFYNWGYVPTKLVFKAIRGEKLKDKYDGGCLEVTKANVDTYAAELIKQAEAYK